MKALKELWTKIKKFSNYDVSSTGKLKNNVTGHFLTIHNNPTKYVRVQLKKNKKPYAKLVHVLVAEAFIPNPNNLPTVNHKDKNRSNNNVENLEWMTQKEQVNHANKNKIIKRTGAKRPIIQYSFEGKIIKEFDSAKTASLELNISRSGIVLVCRKKRDTFHGFIFKYAEDKQFENEIWKKYNKDYDILLSNYGRIKFKTGRITSGSTTANGYKTINIKNITLEKSYGKLIHVMVAQTFLDNKKKLPTVNHKDGNKTNNKVDNLEWSTHSAQQKHAYKNNLKKAPKGICKSVAQYKKDKTLVKIYKSIADAGRKTKISRKCISNACNGTQKTAGKYIWKFVN